MRVRFVAAWRDDDRAAFRSGCAHGFFGGPPGSARRYFSAEPWPNPLPSPAPRYLRAERIVTPLRRCRPSMLIPSAALFSRSKSEGSTQAPLQAQRPRGEVRSSTWSTSA